MHEEKGGDDNLASQEVEKCLDLCARVLEGLDSFQNPRFPYRLREVKGTLVALNRLRPSSCHACARIHEHENPFLIVGGSPGQRHHTMVLLLAVLQLLQVVQHQTTREGLADRASRA